ncbi:acyl carrier protein [Micromonospora sp. NPDC049559]|uniref:acyl carrier protein n=1 Tax=Micromonospora sp. NPDC049559 TaxID=3155923 RepID=UPI0034277987
MTQPDNVSAARLRELAAEVFDVSPEEVTPEAAFYEDLGVDSLQKVEFVVRLERHFGVRLTDQEAAELHDLGDALAALESRGLSVGP